MKCNFIHIKLKDRNIYNLKYNKIQELFELSIGNNVKNLKYNENKKVSSNQNLEIIYYKRYIKKNIGKMDYFSTEKNKSINIFNKKFIRNNLKRAKIIINNKQYDLIENIKNEMELFNIKIKFLDNIFFLNSMFEDCKSLSAVHNFQNFNTKYLKTIYNLFYRCNSLLYIDDISNWNINNINDISKIFYECLSLESLSDISKWNTYNITNISFLFYECINLK